MDFLLIEQLRTRLTEAFAHLRYEHSADATLVPPAVFAGEAPGADPLASAPSVVIRPLSGAEDAAEAQVSLALVCTAYSAEGGAVQAVMNLAYAAAHSLRNMADIGRAYRLVLPVQTAFGTDGVQPLPHAVAEVQAGWVRPVCETIPNETEVSIYGSTL